jgi:hypothetical protein
LVKRQRGLFGGFAMTLGAFASEQLGSWPWVAINPAKPKEPKRFEARTYIDARALAAKWFRLPETVVQVRVVFEYELAKPASEAA